MLNQSAPVTTWLYRLVHVSSLPTLLAREALHAPNCVPADGLSYRAIHKPDVHASRRVRTVPCGPGGSIHDYVQFYFGTLSPMLLNLKTGRVPGYNEGQASLLYLVTSVQQCQSAGCRFVFTDGHGLAGFTGWYDDLARLDRIDWDLVKERYWSDTPEDNDRQRRKQAEFLVWQSVPWTLIRAIGVFDVDIKGQVEAILARFPNCHQPRVAVRRGWYFN